MIKINSEKELLGLLKIISSEAVGISKRLNENADPTTSNYLKQYEIMNRNEQQMYDNIARLTRAMEQLVKIMTKLVRENGW